MEVKAPAIPAFVLHVLLLATCSKVFRQIQCPPWCRACSPGARWRSGTAGPSGQSQRRRRTSRTAGGAAIAWGRSQCEGLRSAWSQRLSQGLSSTPPAGVRACRHGHVWSCGCRQPCLQTAPNQMATAHPCQAAPTPPCRAHVASSWDLNQPGVGHGRGGAGGGCDGEDDVVGAAVRVTGTEVKRQVGVSSRLTAAEQWLVSVFRYSLQLYHSARY